MAPGSPRGRLLPAVAALVRSKSRRGGKDAPGGDPHKLRASSDPLGCKDGTGAKDVTPFSLERVSSASASSAGASTAGGGGAGKPRLTTISSVSYTRGVMHQRAATKYQQMTTRYTSRKHLQERDRVLLPRWVVHPHDILAQCWWTFILCTVVVTLFVEPYSLAFAHYPGLYPLSSPDTILAIIFTAVYASDVLLNFFVAFYEGGMLVTDLRAIAVHYARWRLWVDLVTTIPFDWIVLGCMGLQQSNSRTAWFISLLRLLRLGRAYRLYGWVQFLTYNQTLSLIAVTLMRNFFICFFVVHWAACFFYYIAKQSNEFEASWIAKASGPEFKGLSTVEQYIVCVYWSVITFATVGYGDLHAYTTAEAVFVIIYVFINIALAAYIIGTITLLVVKGDEKTGLYRASLTALDAYSSTHEIPPVLKSAMKGHLQLHFSSADSSDEAVLGMYPTNIRRRILRHLYNAPLQRCWLFEECTPKFLDALLALAKVELYMPKVDIVCEGDHINELYLLVAGQAIGERGNSAATTGCTEGLMLQADGASSVHGGMLHFLEAGDPVGEMAFFTETPCMESVRTQTMCRVLVLPRSSFTALTNDFPLNTSQFMKNLVARATKMVEDTIPGPMGSRVMESLESLGSLGLKFASPELVDGPTGGGLGGDASNSSGGGRGLTRLPIPGLARHSFSGPFGGANPSGLGQRSSFQLAKDSVPVAVDSIGLPLRTSQKQVLANLLRVRALVNQSRARLEQQRTNEFLNACCDGNLDRIRVMLQQGCDVNCADYDGRTGLMLAASKGANAALKLLLLAGASVNLQDQLGGTALLAAVKGGHDESIELLMCHDARLMVTPVMTAAHLCTAVFDGDMPLLKRLLHAGANANAADYDKRTALHIAAADGNLPAVKLLLERGGANIAACDRWDQSALDEARRAGATPVVLYLQSRVGEGAAEESLDRFQFHQAQEMLSAASKGRAAACRALLDRGCPPDACDYDRRTGLMLAAAHGHGEVVSLLLAAGANPNARDSLGSSPLLEAVKGGWQQVVAQLVGAGASLQLSASELSSALCSMVQQDEEALLRRYIAAGADVTAGDYNGQTPLHIAAAEGSLPMVKLLVEQGGADAGAMDRWGATPLDEATHAGAADVLAFLRGAVRAAKPAPPRSAAAQRHHARTRQQEQQEDKGQEGHSRPREPP